MLDLNAETREPIQQPTLRIDPQILSALNLTQEDVDNLNREKLKLGQAEKTGKAMGIEYYGKISMGQSVDSVKLGNLTVPNNVPTTDIADFANKSMLQNGDSLTNPNTETGYSTRGFLEGLGTSSLDVKDWKTAIRSFDVITEGGIMKNDKVIGQLRTIADNDKKVAVAIAEQLNERLNKGKPTETPPAPQLSPAYAASRQPDAPLRPAPANPAQSGLNPY